LLFFIYLGIIVVCDFWQRLNFVLVDKQMKTEEIFERFGGLFKDLHIGLLKLVKFDDNVFVELNQAKSRNLKDQHSYKETISYRKSIKMFFNDSSNYLGFDFLYNSIILPALTETIAAIKSDMNNITGWALLEAEIFGFQAICRNIDEKKDLSFLDALFDTIIEIPENLVQIKKTATDVIDEIGSVLSYRPNIVMKLFNYLLAGLENELTTSKQLKRI